MPNVADYIIDLALAEFDTATAALYVCSAEPTTYAQASSTYALGTKAGISITEPYAGATTGRRVTVEAISGGSITATGTATHWAITKDGATLMATGELGASAAVTSGGSFSTAAFDIGLSVEGATSNTGTAGVPIGLLLILTKAS